MLTLQLKDMLFEQEHVTFRNVSYMGLWMQALTKIKHGSFVIYQNNHLIFKPIVDDPIRSLCINKCENHVHIFLSNLPCLKASVSTTYV